MATWQRNAKGETVLVISADEIEAAAEQDTSRRRHRKSPLDAARHAWQHNPCVKTLAALSRERLAQLDATSEQAMALDYCTHLLENVDPTRAGLAALEAHLRSQAFSARERGATETEAAYRGLANDLMYITRR